MNLLLHSFRSVSSDLQQCMLIIMIISTDDSPSLRIERFAIVYLCGVSTKLCFD